MAMTSDYIEYLDDQIGIAPANSEEEYQAAGILFDIFGAHGLEPKVQEFDAPSVVGFTYGIVLVLLFVGMLFSGIGGSTLRVIGGLLALVAGGLLISCYFGKNLLEKFGPSVRSQNVIAYHKASGPLVSKGVRPIVIVAHYDTPREDILSKPAFAPRRSLIMRAAIYCVPVATVLGLFGAFLFIPEGARAFFWIIGLIASLPCLLWGVSTIASRFMPCTIGSNDNKASIATMLGVLECVSPSSDDLVPRRQAAPEESPAAGDGAAAASAQDAQAAPMVAEEQGAVEAIEPEQPVAAPVPAKLAAIRHGENTIRGLGMLPEDCEIEYVEPAASADAGATAVGRAVRPRDDGFVEDEGYADFGMAAAPRSSSDQGDEPDMSQDADDSVYAPVEPRSASMTAQEAAATAKKLATSFAHKVSGVVSKIRSSASSEKGGDEGSLDDAAGKEAATHEAEGVSAEATSEVARQADDAEKTVPNGEAVALDGETEPIKIDKAPAEKDSTGLDVISEEEPGADGTTPMTISQIKAVSSDSSDVTESSSWGKTEYQPSVVNVARRAALFDLPDPSHATVDPFGGTPADSKPKPMRIPSVDPSDFSSTDFDRGSVSSSRPRTATSDGPSTYVPSPVRLDTRARGAVVSGVTDTGEMPVAPVSDDISVSSVLHKDEIGVIPSTKAPHPNDAHATKKKHHVFGRNKKEQESMSEWLGVDEDFDAKKDGRAIGTWDNFDSDENGHGSSKPGWKGGATRSGGFDGGEDKKDPSTLQFVPRPDSVPDPSGSESRPANVIQEPFGVIDGLASDVDSAGIPSDATDGAENDASAKKPRLKLLKNNPLSHDDEDMGISPEDAAALAEQEAERKAEEEKRRAERREEARLRESILRMADDELLCHDIWFVALGASSLDHAGIKAFLSEYRTNIRGAFLINLDSVGAGVPTVLTEEGLGGKRKADRRLVKLLTSTADDLHCPLAKKPRAWADTDATPAMRRSIRAATIMGMDEGGGPAFSHTADDVPENIDELQLVDICDLVTEAIRRS